MKREIWTDRHAQREDYMKTEREGHVPSEAEPGAMQPPDKDSEESWQPPEAGRNKEGRTLPGASRGSGPCDTLSSDIWTPELGGNTRVFFKAPDW